MSSINVMDQYISYQASSAGVNPKTILLEYGFQGELIKDMKPYIRLGNFPSS